MSGLDPVVVPRVLWGAVAVVSVIIAVVRSVRARRRSSKGAPSSPRWDPFGPDSTWALPAAAVGYAVVAVWSGHFGWGDAARSVWWSTLSASALAYVAKNRPHGLPVWGTPLFAAVGAALLGPLPA
ncbi:hypothetical protein OHT52_11560 [Streptomyces sp. NBC_00247]|uniref:hypothetical protein n=1 Tax=Streptomyces sp. NBC_00247 TaxID=2975689 RepID=UPI002E2E6AF2|nr:hypothetical protein [Streptomyces sp. NBC_00247]